MEGMPTDVVGYVGGGLKLIELSGLGHLDYKETQYLKDDTWIYFCHTKRKFEDIVSLSDCKKNRLWCT